MNTLKELYLSKKADTGDALMGGAVGAGLGATAMHGYNEGWFGDKKKAVPKKTKTNAIDRSSGEAAAAEHVPGKGSAQADELLTQQKYDAAAKAKEQANKVKEVKPNLNAIAENTGTTMAKSVTPAATAAAPAKAGFGRRLLRGVRI